MGGHCPLLVNLCGTPWHQPLALSAAQGRSEGAPGLGCGQVPAEPCSPPSAPNPSKVLTSMAGAERKRVWASSGVSLFLFCPEECVGCALPSQASKGGGGARTPTSHPPVPPTCSQSCSFTYGLLLLPTGLSDPTPPAGPSLEGAGWNSFQVGTPTCPTSASIVRAAGKRDSKGTDALPVEGGRASPEAWASPHTCSYCMPVAWPRVSLGTTVGLR